MDSSYIDWLERNYDRLMGLIPDEYQIYIAWALYFAVISTILTYAIGKWQAVLRREKRANNKWRRDNHLPTRK